MFGVQFHPEVVHTPEGKKVLANFLFKVCGGKSTLDTSFVYRAGGKRNT